MHVIGEIAAIAGVTVRTLHHYDEIGLLVPSARSDAGYRLYDDADVARLQRILLHRELGFTLEEVRELLDDDVDAAEHLARQLATLDERIERMERIRKAVEQALEATEMGSRLTAEEMLEVFGEQHAADHETYAAEAEERWGDTDAWQQSRRRTSSYDKAAWAEVKAEVDDIHAAFAEALRDGAPADGERAMDVAERHRRHIHDRFYDCSHEMHVDLGEMYVADARFTRTYEDVEPGLAAYVRDAIVANAERSTPTYRG